MRASSKSITSSASEPPQRDPQTPLRLQAEDAVHRRGAHPDQVHPPAQPLTQLTVLQRRDPQLGHEIATGELGQHTRVDLVGLAGQRRDVTDLAGMRDLHPPASRGELIARPDRAAHHLHHRADLGAALDHQPRQAVSVGRHRTLTDDRAGVAERTPRRSAIGPIDPEILHDRASPSRVETADQLSLRGGPPPARPPS
jgi:hypothetical protein